MHCPLLKISTNQGLVGFGEVRDAGDKRYALMLKSRLIGENPTRVDKLFRRIKQFGSHGRQGGGVSGIEIALWDLAGKAYGVPVYQMLGGKFRDRIRIYCDTDAGGKESGKEMGEALKRRMELGYTFLKMDLGLGQIASTEGAVNAPLGFLEEARRLERFRREHPATADAAGREARAHLYDHQNIAHPFTGLHITETGFELLERYVADVRSVVGYGVPLAIDHVGHIGLADCIKLARRLEPYAPAWLEDLLPWQYTSQYERLAASCAVPLCTGEDIYLKEGFRPLLEAGALAVIHPDILTAGGILELKKIGDMAQEYGTAMAIHMAESPIACLAAVHAAAATENFLALEYHSVDVPWWDDIVESRYLTKPIVQEGYIAVPEGPGLGIEALNDETISRHLHPDIPGMWKPTDEWNESAAHDRLWS